MGTRIVLLGGYYDGNELIHQEPAWPWVTLTPVWVQAENCPRVNYEDTRRRDRAYRRIFKLQGTQLR